MDRKGIVIAHRGSDQLYPATSGMSKFLLPVYDKPMIYYPLSSLMLAGIRDILIVSNETDIARYRLALGDGANFGLRLSFTCLPEGADPVLAILTDDRFISGDPIALIDGDTLLHGPGLHQILRSSCRDGASATTFVSRIANADYRDTVMLDDHRRALSIRTAGLNAGSQFAVTGLHFFDVAVFDIARSLVAKGIDAPATPQILQAYLDRGMLDIATLGRGFAWLDMRTHSDLLAAAQFIETIQKRQGAMIACLEEIGWQNGWLEPELVHAAGSRLAKSRYGRYLLTLAETAGNDGHSIGRTDSNVGIVDVKNSI